MKTLSRAACATILTVLITVAAHADPLQPVRVTPDELTWKPTPGGNHRALLAGDPQKAGLYIYHTRYSAGFRNQPHFHPDERIVTILSGTLLVGYGEQVDASKMKALPAGSVFTEPSQRPHFVWAKDGEVVIQVVGHDAGRDWLVSSVSGPDGLDRRG
jgi:hypothetical protein